MAKFRATKLPKATGQSTGATPVNINLIDLASPVFCEAINDQGVHVELVAIARKDSSGETASAKVSAIAKRISGTLTVIESGTATFLGLGDLAIAGLAVNSTGTTLRANVTGIALTTINWTVHTELWTD